MICKKAPRCLYPAVLLLLAALSAPPLAAGELKPGQDPVSVYAELDGEWAGEFVGWDTSGKELYRIEVQQVYRTIDGETQEVEITDRSADGSVTTGKGRNIARLLPDGSLELICIVEKSNGERVEHRGVLVKGPTGQTELVWQSTEKAKEEIFRERVLKENGEEIYAIDGLGRYGDTLILMAGRYKRIGKAGETGTSRKTGKVGEAEKAGESEADP